MSRAETLWAFAPDEGYVRHGDHAYRVEIDPESAWHVHVYRVRGEADRRVGYGVLDDAGRVEAITGVGAISDKTAREVFAGVQPFMSDLSLDYLLRWGPLASARKNVGHALTIHLRCVARDLLYEARGGATYDADIGAFDDDRDEVMRAVSCAALAQQLLLLSLSMDDNSDDHTREAALLLRLAAGESRVARFGASVAEAYVARLGPPT